MSDFLDDLMYEEVMTNERLLEIATYYSENKVIYLDMETSSLDPRLGCPWITSLYFEDGPVFNVNMWHVDLTVIKEFLETRLIVGAELKFDLKWLRHLGIRPRRILDVIIQSRILNTGLKKANALAVLADFHLGVKLRKDLRPRWFRDYREVKIMTRPPIWDDEMQRYAASDVFVLPTILRKQRIALEKEGLMETARLENGLVPIVSDMEYDGIPVDPVRWKEIVDVAKVEMGKLKIQLATELVGKKVSGSLFNDPMDILNIDSPLAVKEAFATEKGIMLENMAKLTISSSKYELPKLYSKYKEYAKQVQTYGDSWIAQMHPITGKIHSSFLQLSDRKEAGDSEGQTGGTDTARFSSRDPNVQNIPHNDHNKYPKGHEFWSSQEALEKGLVYNPALSDWSYRDCFIAPPGYAILKSDLSQAEVRILADVSEDQKLIADIASGIDIHTAVAASMFKKNAKDVTKEERTKGKTLNFAVIYGLGAESLAARLDLVNKYNNAYKTAYPRMVEATREEKAVKAAKQEAQGLIDAYFKTYQGVKAWITWAREQGMGVGYAKTIIGRKRYFPPIPEEVLTDPDQMRTYAGSMQRMSANSPIQGSCADMTKKAMISIGNYIYLHEPDCQLINSVHDEVVVLVPLDRVEVMKEQVVDRMLAAANSMLKIVKMEAECSVADRWIK